MIGYLARKALGGKGGGGLSTAKISMLPDHILMPVKRNGLDPVPDLARHRAEGGVSRIKFPLGIGAWLVTGYDDVRTVLGSTDRFSNDYRHLAGVVGMEDGANPGGLGFSDPPEHTRLRKLVMPEFTGRRLARLTPLVEGIVTERLDALAAAAANNDGVVDLMAEFALPIPALSICELLGVPYADRAEFQRLSAARFDMLEGAQGALSAITDALPYLEQLVRANRESPGEGILGRLVADHGDELTDEELTGLADGLLTGGLETTASMLGLGTILLLQRPDVHEALRTDDAVIEKFLDELLRYMSVVQVAFPRFAKEDIELGGQRIAKGDIVIPSLSGANRDPKFAGAEPEAFDLHRESSRRHVAFGFGAHRCVGAELGKLEMRTAFPRLVRRFPEMSLAMAPEEIPYRKRSIVFGLDKLLVDLGPDHG
ncbi:cytochrome P450 [Pseudonocardia thermophila]|uniref:cytochrome P450 n=1 Tax=Pseudonocardia thermophila TaxID=1848 RepID=UPI00389B08BB